MFNPNWFLLIFFIKVLIAAIGLIQGAPIDLVPASTEVHNDNQTVTVPNENITTETTGTFGEHNHVDVENESDDLIAINEDFENETTSLPSLGASRHGQESQQEVTTTTGSPSTTDRNYETNTDQIHVEVVMEEVTDISNSPISTEKPENISHQNSVYTEKSSFTSSESADIATDRNQRKIINSEIRNENPQKGSEHIPDQPPQESVQLPGELKIREVFNSTIETENPQISTDQNTAEIQTINEQTSLGSVQSAGEHKPSDAFNSQIEIENPQIFTNQKLDESQQITEETIPEEPKITEMFNSQIEIENPQISTEENFTQIQEIAAEPSTQTSLESAESEIVNSHIINENSQNTSELNLLKIQQIGDETSLDTTQGTIIGEIIDSQIKSENPQNDSKKSMPELTQTSVENSIDKVNVSEEPQTSDFFNSQIGSENIQNTIQLNFPENREMKEESAFESVSDTKEIKISEVLNSQQAHENPHSITTDLSKEKTDLNQEISQQINAQIIDNANNKETSENGNSQIEMENLQNVHIDINTEQMSNQPEESGNINYISTSEKSPINNSTIKTGELEITTGILDDPNETQANDIINPQSSQQYSKEVLNEMPERDTANQTDLQSPEINKTQELLENNTEISKMSLSEEISTLINLLKPADSQESDDNGTINSEVSVENYQNVNNIVTTNSEIPEGNVNEPNQQVNSAEFNSQILFENTQNSHLNSFIEEINQNVGLPSEEGTKSELSEENIYSQLLREKLQYPGISAKPETDDDQLTHTNFQDPKENNDNFNSQTFNENLQNADIIAMLTKLEDNLTKTDKKDQHWASDSENIKVEVLPEQSENTENYAVEEKRNLNLENVQHMNSEETVESRNFNSQISTENPPVAGIYVLMEKNKIPSENINDNSAEHKDHGNTQENSQSVTENPQTMDTIELAKETPTESRVLNEIKQNINAPEIAVETEDPGKMEVEQSMNNLKRDANIGEETMVTATTMTDASLDNIQNQIHLDSFKTLTSSMDNAELHDSKPLDKTSLFYDPNSSEEVDDATQKINTITTEEVAETSTETFTESPMEESTFIHAEDLETYPKGMSEVNIQKAFETLTESFKATEITETNTEQPSTAQPLDTTPPATNTEAGTGEETTDTITNDRSPYVKATTHRQFASLLEETEMNVHKAFETLREWIANGKKLEDATKNPLLPEDATTMSTEEKTGDNGILITNEYSTTENSEETTSTLNEYTTGASPTQEEGSSANEKGEQEITDTTVSPMLITTTPLQDAVVESTDNIGPTDGETTTNNQETLESVTTEQAQETSEGQETVETTTTNDITLDTTVEPILARVNLQKDFTSVSLTHFDDSSEEIVGENNVQAVEKSNSRSHGDNEYQIPVTDLIQTEDTTDRIQDMVTFVEHQPTTQKQETSQSLLSQTQASFMEEQQQQIEATTETDMSSQSISEENVATTVAESTETEINTTTTREGQSTTTESVATTIVVPLTTTVVPLTTTTADDLTTTTEEPEAETTTVVVAAEPEARSLPLPPPKLEYLQNEDGVEVFYGYSIVKHN